MQAPTLETGMTLLVSAVASSSPLPVVQENLRLAARACEEGNYHEEGPSPGLEKQGSCLGRHKGAEAGT